MRSIIPLAFLSLISAFDATFMNKKSTFQVCSYVNYLYPCIKPHKDVNRWNGHEVNLRKASSVMIGQPKWHFDHNSWQVANELEVW